MKAIIFFYIGAGIDIITLIVAFYFILTDMAKGRGGTNNPTMYTAVLILAALVGGAFWLKSAGKLGFANTLLWLPGFPLAAYGLMILLFIIFKPDMR